LDNVELIQKDGSPCGSKYFLLWNPPLYRTKEGGSKGSSVTRRSRYLHTLVLIRVPDTFCSLQVYNSNFSYNHLSVHNMYDCSLVAGMTLKISPISFSSG
jgi:hypothetical protein